MKHSKYLLVAYIVIGKRLYSTITFSKVNGQSLHSSKSWNVVVVVVVVAAGPPPDLVISELKHFMAFHLEIYRSTNHLIGKCILSKKK